MTKDDEYAARLREILTGPRRNDVEALHCLAQQIIVEALRAEGLPNTADAFEAIPKWYA